MGFVLGINLKWTTKFHLDIRKVKKDVACVRYLSIGMKMHVVPLETINWEQDHFRVGKWGKDIGKKP